MAQGQLHLIKLCVGAEHPDDLLEWQESQRRKNGRTDAVHVTRMWPRRAAELLRGGSLYWVMKGFIKVRQPILSLEKVVGEDGISRCAILLSADMVNVELTPRRAFQGWRYLEGVQVPRDNSTKMPRGDDLPDGLNYELARLGVR